MTGITQKSSVAAFPLWFLEKQKSWLKRNKKKDIVGISIIIAYWRFHLRPRTSKKVKEDKVFKCFFSKSFR